MFSGIIAGVFPIVDLRQGDHCIHYVVKLNESMASRLQIGDSIAIDGVCHTVEKIQGVDIALTSGAETLRRTTLADLKLGQHVHVELSLAMGETIGGHLMSGHIWGKAIVVNRNFIGPNLELILRVPEDMVSYLFEKGFVGIEGASITVNRVDPIHHTFSVLLIPHTLKVTLFSEKQEGAALNIELDSQTVTIVDTVKRILEARGALLHPG